MRKLQDEIAAVKALLRPAAAAGSGAAAGLAGERRAAIERQGAQVSSQMERLTTQRDEMAAQASALESSIRETPRVGSELDALSRDLAALQALRADVTRRHAEARTGAELEASQQSERFEIVEPAEVPELPIGPNRKHLAALGAAASLAIAGGFAFLLELFNPAPRTSAAMERLTGLRPVVAIPYVYARGERARRRLRWAGVLALLGLGVGFGVPALDRELPEFRAAMTRLATAAGFGSTSEAAARAPDL